MKRFLLVVGILLACASASAQTNIASSANFKSTLVRLLEDIDKNNAYQVITSSTGKLSAQIDRNAPFDIFLSADIISPKLGGKTVGASEFTYAIGQLALVQKNSAFSTLNAPQHLNCIAIANPLLAPYGRAAEALIDTLTSKGWHFDRVIKGQSVAQAFQFFDTGACDYALVAYAQVLDQAPAPAHILVPAELHPPIRQNAVLLKRAANNAKALHFMAFLKSDSARKIIQEHGYLVEPLK